MRVLEVPAILRQAAGAWLDDKAARLSAALAYYSLLSLAPLLVISVAIVGFFFGPDAARGRVSRELSKVVGWQAAQGVQAVIAGAHAPTSGVVSAVIGVVTLFIGASGVFGELQDSLNTIWKVRPQPGRGFIEELQDRFWSFVMVLCVALLLLISLVGSSALSVVGALFANALPGGELLWQGLTAALSLGISTGLFALIFKVVPDARVEWREAWGGAILTGVLFTLGKLLLGLYLGRAAIGSAYGAAGSLIVLVVWVYYAAQIFFLGAEFTRALALHGGRVAAPSASANAAAPTNSSGAAKGAA